MLYGLNHRKIRIGQNEIASGKYFPAMPIFTSSLAFSILSISFFHSLKSFLRGLTFQFPTNYLADIVLFKIKRNFVNILYSRSGDNVLRPDIAIKSDLSFLFFVYRLRGAGDDYVR